MQQQRSLIEIEALTPRRPGPWNAAETRQFELVIPELNARLTEAVLKNALGLSQGLNSKITILSVHALPYPLPLERSADAERRFAAKVKELSRATGLPLTGRLVFARDTFAGFRHALSSNAIVLVGTRRRWWRTWEERIARALAAEGHNVALVRV